MPFLAAGNLTVEDGPGGRGQCGGAGLHAALGMWVWDQPTTLLAGVGTDFPAGWLDRLGTAGIDTSWIWSTGEPHALRPGPADPAAWPLYSPSVQRLPPADFAGAHAGPGPIRQVADLVDALADQAGVLTLDQPWWDGLGGVLTPTLRRLSALLPDADELAGQADLLAPAEGGGDPWKLAARLAADCRTVVIRRGTGCVVLRSGAAPVQLPGPPAADRPGVGAAFCGGFCVGLAATGDPVRAAGHGAVAASYVLEHADPLDVLDADRGDARRRLSEVLRTAVEVGPA
jgi:sugar/nucleoside kinase (ribokinase family)